MAQRRWLSGMDTAFVLTERAPVNMNIGALLVFEPGDAAFEDLVAHIDRRLERIPRFRQRLAEAPFGVGRPAWVDDQHFDVNFHVRNVGLGGTGDERALLDLFGRLISVPLDRSRPLWELWVVDLDDGRSAVIQKIHHAMVDGVSDADMLIALLDLAREPADTVVDTPPRWEPEPVPSRLALLAEAASERMRRFSGAGKGLASGVRSPSRAVKQAGGVARALAATAGAMFASAPSTSLTGEIGSRRRFEIVRARLDDVKEKKNRHGVTVNDVVLAAVSCGLRDLLRSRGEDVEALSLRATVPISVRSTTGQGDLGNQFAPLLVRLPVGEADPLRCLADLHEQMVHLKGSPGVGSTDALFDAVELIPTSIIALGTRSLLARQHVMDLMITNIPGPPFPMYFMGAELEEVFPYVPLLQHTSVGVAIVSYNGALNFGLSGDWDSTADLAVLAEGIAKALSDM